MHRIMPDSIDRVIMLDADLKFLADIAKLYRHFDEFGYTNIVGIGHEAQPVSHFWKNLQFIFLCIVGNIILVLF